MSTYAAAAGGGTIHTLTANFSKGMSSGLLFSVLVLLELCFFVYYSFHWWNLRYTKTQTQRNNPPHLAGSAVSHQQCKYNATNIYIYIYISCLLVAWRHLRTLERSGTQHERHLPTVFPGCACLWRSWFNAGCWFQRDWLLHTDSVQPFNLESTSGSGATNPQQEIERWVVHAAIWPRARHNTTTSLSFVIALLVLYKHIF